MPSRKRNKGKNRKARKDAERVEGERARVRKVWQGWARMGKWNAGVQCNHGFADLIPEDDNHPICGFMDAYFGNWNDMTASGILRDTFQKHPEVWTTDNYRKMTVNILVSIGTNFLLEEYEGDKTVAFAIVVLENYDGREDLRSKLRSPCVLTKIRNVCVVGTKRDQLKFYRKRTTCKCLKKMHLESRRSLPKLGECSHCDKLKERSSLMVCSRCRVEEYCSRECQMAHWHVQHKNDCSIPVSVHEEQMSKRGLLEHDICS